MKKVLWFDTETTGFSPVKNDIIQIAGLIELDGEIMEEFNIKFQPVSYEHIQPKALEINKMTLEQIKEFQSAEEGCREIVAILDNAVSDGIKLVPAGHNVSFDVNFLREFLVKTGWNKRVEEYLKDEYICTKEIAKNGKRIFDNHKLTTIAEDFGIEYDAHDALADIQTTRKIYQLLTAEA
jgi:DNA polymerase III alpha subunit (gram-positive type)